MRHKEDNTSGNRVRRIFGNEVAGLDARRNKFTQLCQLRIDIQSATIAVNKRKRRRMTQGRFLVIIHFVLNVVDNGAGILTAARRARVVEVKDGRNLFRCSRAIVVPRRNINRRRNNAVAVIAPKRFHARDFRVVAHRIVDNHLGNACLVGQYCNPLKFFVAGFFFIRHPLPLGIAADFTHFVAGVGRTDNFTAERGLFE